jgi:putative flippase GtrA
VIRTINQNLGQFVRYAAVGLSLNATMYVVYLIITARYFTPFEAVFLLYPLSTLVGFYAHRELTFKINSDRYKFFDFLKYIFFYILGLLLNLLLIYIFFEKLGYPHQLVQLFAVGIVALFLFVSIRLFVFPVAKDKGSRLV